jgi:hypothetical protein
MRQGVRVNADRWFAAWVVVGCGLAFGMVSLGPLVLVPVAVVAALLSRIPAARGWAYGTLTGIGLLLLFVAWLNRDGAGLNPLPWLALGVAFVAGGFVAHRLRHR